MDNQPNLYDRAAEQAVLGSMLIDDRCISDVAAVLTPESFYIDVNRELYKTITGKYERQETIDPLTLSSDPEMRSYILKLMDATTTAAHAMAYVELVREKSALRAVQAAATNTLQLVSDGAPLEDVQNTLTLAATQIESKSSINIICLSDVELESVDWLWCPYIPLGKITILQGDPGLGKTFVATRLAAIVTTGGVFPTGDNMAPSEIGNVLFQTAEDGLGDTIKARLLDAGADCSKVFVIDESKEGLTLDSPKLREAVKKLRPKLIVIDPLQAYLGEKKDMYRANEVRPVMSRLGALAAEYKCAIVLIGHLNKAGGGKSIHRGLGSVDIPAAARSVLAVGEMPNEKTRRAIVQIKSSLAPSGQTILFDLDPAYGFMWAGTSDLTADDVLNYHPPVEREAPAREEAEEFIRELLKDGKMRGKDVEAEAREYGISAKTLRDARERLGVICTKGKGLDKAWYWELAYTKTHSQDSQDGQVTPQDDYVVYVDRVKMNRQVTEIPLKGEI